MLLCRLHLTCTIKLHKTLFSQSSPLVCLIQPRLPPCSRMAREHHCAGTCRLAGKLPPPNSACDPQATQQPAMAKHHLWLICCRSSGRAGLLPATPAALTSVGGSSHSCAALAGLQGRACCRLNAQSKGRGPSLPGLALPGAAGRLWHRRTARAHTRPPCVRVCTRTCCVAGHHSCPPAACTRPELI